MIPMSRRWMKKIVLLHVFAGLSLMPPLYAAEHHGKVLFNGMPMPGATVTASQGTHKVVTSSDELGNYSFADLADGTWSLEIQMLGFAPTRQDISVAAGKPGVQWEMKMLPLADVLAQAKQVKLVPPVAETATVNSEEKKPSNEKSKAAPETRPAPAPSDENAQANDGLLVNGSVNNAATSQFSLDKAFGNTRSSRKSLYTGGLGMVLGNSALDARPFSLSGIDSPKQQYSRLTLIATLGGPINIPHLMPRGPSFSLVYAWERDSQAAAQTGLVPTVAQRSLAEAGDPVARSLLDLYPLPNSDAGSQYNYQIPVLNNTHQDTLQAHMDKQVSNRDSISGVFAFESMRAGSSNLFRFRDLTNTLGINAKLNVEHRIGHGFYGNAGYEFSRARTEVVPFFENRTNISGNAGMTGTNQDPANWGPPTLVFSSGIASLTDVQSAFDRNRTDRVAIGVQWYYGRHNVNFGGDFRRQEFNYFSQQNPRGTFTFTGAAYGSDFADFIHGTPDTAALVSGNPDKYLRESVMNLYVTDDWRLRPELSINLGVRWEYSAPVTELKNRLANLDVSQNYAQVAQVLATNPKGSLSGQSYPNSLLRPDFSKVEPRVGISWRPIAGSSLVVRAGYGIYADTSLYESMALQLAQQAPFSKSISASNETCAQSLQTGPTPCSENTANTFAVDPNYRVGFAQIWQVSAQRDLPSALQLTVTYRGIHGSNGAQDFLPNTYALGSTNPCPSCAIGFVYRTSTGFSSRESGSVQLRRRLRSGLTATLLYTYAKSVDDDSFLGGQGPLSAGDATASSSSSSIAQDWTNLKAQKGRSNFDQRHLLNFSFQYTTGMGVVGGTLMHGWAGRIYKEWTLSSQLKVGSGLPETPIYLASVSGTGFTGTLRPNRTSNPLYAAAAGHFVNVDAFDAPQSGAWGNAGRNSITGPSQFSFDTSLARTFRLKSGFNLDIRADSTNLLNRVVYSSYNTTLNPASSSSSTAAASSPLFGLPISANAMRSVHFTARLRF